VPWAPRPSFFGSVASGVGGFVVGGLLGRMLFGISTARPAFGLGELVLFGVAAYLVFTLFHQRRGAAAPALASAGAPVISVPTGNRGPEPSFDRNALVDGARAMYAGIQSALVMQDMGMFRSRLTPELYATLQAECDRLRHAKQSKHVEKIDVEQADVSEAWQKDGRECARVRLAGSLLEHTTDDASGTALAGADVSPRPFEEYWTFTRPAGSKAWRLAAMQTA
jgi:predicted lipid-binding transport protein (Tim44 family)